VRIAMVVVVVYFRTGVSKLFYEGHIS